MADYSLKKYPVIGSCRLNCGLYPRYYAEGSSRYPGCGGHDFLNRLDTSGEKNISFYKHFGHRIMHQVEYLVSGLMLMAMQRDPG